jgi:hypothetical protein
MEGTAELFATHRMDDQTGLLALGIMPRTRDEVPMLGRIKLIRDAVMAEHSLSLPAVLRIDNRQPLDNESYAWTWAAAKWLDSHPRYQHRFRELRNHVLEINFNEIVQRAYADDWPAMLAEWQAFVATLDYGYDFERMAIDFQRVRPLAESANRVTVAADRGWQPSGVLLQPAKTYRITASGRYQIAAEQIDGALEPWPCEPGGITLEYHEGRPLGTLLGAIVQVPNSAEHRADNEAGFAKPIEIGLGCTLTPNDVGTLYLRVNDSGGRLADNRGSLQVTIAEVRE